MMSNKKPGLRKMVLVMGMLTTVLATRHIMVLLHEWTHGAAAWMSGLKAHPFAIHYSGWMLMGVHENVDYASLFIAGRNGTAAWIAGSALLLNAVLFLACIPFMLRNVSSRFNWGYTVIFWFAVMNIGQVYSYVPIRTFVGNRGDVGHFLHGTGLSPWVLFVPGMVLVALGIYFVLTKGYWQLNRVFAIESRTGENILLALILFVLFFWFGGAAFHDYGFKDVRSTASLFSVILGMAIFCFSIVRYRSDRTRK